MTAVHHYTIRCDHPGCPHRFTALERTAQVTRELARRSGWSTEIVAVGSRRQLRDICPVHGPALAAFSPPAEVAGVPCLCDARGQGPCLAHLDGLHWGQILASAARSLCTSYDGGDMELLVMRGLTHCTRTHARVALAALGYSP